MKTALEFHVEKIIVNTGHAAQCKTMTEDIRSLSLGREQSPDIRKSSLSKTHTSTEEEGEYSRQRERYITRYTKHFASIDNFKLIAAVSKYGINARGPRAIVEDRAVKYWVRVYCGNDAVPWNDNNDYHNESEEDLEILKSVDKMPEEILRVKNSSEIVALLADVAHVVHMVDKATQTEEERKNEPSIQCTHPSTSSEDYRADHVTTTSHAAAHSLSELPLQTRNMTARQFFVQSENAGVQLTLDEAASAPNVIWPSQQRHIGSHSYSGCHITPNYDMQNNLHLNEARGLMSQDHPASENLQHTIAPSLTVISPQYNLSSQTKPDSDRLYQVGRYSRHHRVRFSGDNDDPINFLEKVHETCVNYGISQPEFFRALSSILVDEAAEWWKANRSQIYAYDDFVELFNIRFCSGARQNNIWSTIRTCTQDEHESINAYITKMKGLFSQLLVVPPIEFQLDIICAQLHPQYSIHIPRSSVNSYRELEERGSELTTQLLNILNYRPPPEKSMFHTRLPARQKSNSSSNSTKVSHTDLDNSREHSGCLKKNYSSRQQYEEADENSWWEK